MSEWLSIEKAPKDGTELILASVRKRQQWFDEWVMDGSDDRGGYWMMCDQWDVPVEPTHFRIPSPLPDAPKETCPRCAGSGFETDSVTPCEFCGGDGWIFRRNAESRAATSPKTPSDAAMRAAEEWFRVSNANVPSAEIGRLAAIITRHLPAAPAQSNYIHLPQLPMNGTELECDGQELRPDGTCARCERINGRIESKVAAATTTPERSREIFDAGFTGTADNEGEGCQRRPWPCRYRDARRCAHDTMLGDDCPKVCSCACHSEGANNEV